MSNEFCPHCKTLRNMTVTTIKKTKGKKKKEKEISIHSYHCEVCGSFIRSKEEVGLGRASLGPKSPSG